MLPPLYIEVRDLTSLKPLGSLLWASDSYTCCSLTLPLLAVADSEPADTAQPAALLVEPPP